ncbi:Lpg1974 family pore-forming outer membrane protein [Waddlia chondrophila]|nr:Lpg1974 family pore-forming outer membrane protein [Waddlia chondrophila]ADI38625.1 putative membrane protein [Waddlia chondrophila WSU 86-1044]
MINMKKAVAAILLTFASLTTTAQADCWDSSCNDCCPDITVGVDWLYWSPCINDRHFALTTDGVDVNTHYFCNEWDFGSRVYAKLGNWWNGFNGALIYTYINPKTSSSLKSDAIILSVAAPDEIPSFNDLDAKWELQYQTLDAVLSYSIDVTQNRCFKIEVFSGLTWIDVKQKTEYVFDLNEGGFTNRNFDRQNDFWAVGPCLGLNSSFSFFDCFKIFGTLKTNLVVGETASKDVLFRKVAGDEKDSVKDEILTTCKVKDRCFCLPGLHLASGIEYEICLYETTFGLRLGWEYVQWINAPTFPCYELDGSRVRSAPSTNNLTMQGIFFGLNSTF